MAVIRMQINQIMSSNLSMQNRRNKNVKITRQQETRKTDFAGKPL
jgi:hypothetical protein